MRWALAIALLALGLAPTGAAAHSLVRVSGPELVYVSADATSLNSLRARLAGGDIELRDPTVDGGSDPGPCRPGAVTPDANAYIVQVLCRRSGIERLRVDLGEREDSAVISLPIPVTLLGGPGADALTAGPAGDSVSGGDGNDRVSGGAGADVLDGGPGADTFDGGAGDDRVRAADGLMERVSCGDGRDRVEADTLDDVAADCEDVVRTAVAPPPDADATGSDSLAPVVRAGASTLQRLTGSGMVRVAATTSERGFVSASGFLRGPGINLPIQSDRKRVAVAGGGAILTVRLKGRSLRVARRALRRGRAVSVRLGVVGTDTAGNSAHVRAPAVRLSPGGAGASATAHPEPGDVDGDGVGDGIDNCPDVRNGDQKNTDGDAQGDKCDPDADDDGVANGGDNCPVEPNADQQDDGPEGTPGNGIGDACDQDSDGDGVFDPADNCPDVRNDQRDNDQDGTGDPCDPDDDEDGEFDTADNCPLAYNYDQSDADGDGRGAACDADDAPKGPGGGSGGPDADTTAPKLSVSVPRRPRLAAVRSGLVVRIRCSEACAATVRLVAGRGLARTLRLRRGGVAGRDVATLGGAASTYAFVRFPSAVKRQVWRRSATKLRLHVDVADRAGNRARVVRSVTFVR